MRLLILVCLAAALWGQKKPEVQIVEVRAHRIEDGKIAVDGRVRVTGEKPIRGLTVIFDFQSTQGQTLTSQKIEVDEESLEPGEESTFHAATLEPPGAVKYKLRAFDRDERELRVGNTGPFVIE